MQIIYDLNICVDDEMNSLNFGPDKKNWDLRSKDTGVVQIWFKNSCGTTFKTW